MSKAFVIYVVAPIGIQTHLASQNDRHNLSFVKGIYVVGKKLAKNGRKMAKLKGCLFFKSPVFTMAIARILQQSKFLALSPKQEVRICFSAHKVNLCRQAKPREEGQCCIIHNLHHIQLFRYQCKKLLQFLVKLYRDLDADDRIELLKLLHLPHFSTSWQYEIEFGKLLRLGLHTSDYHNLWLCSLLSLGCLRWKSNYGK